MNKKNIIIGNWKCNPPTQREAESLIREVKKNIKYVKNVEIVIAPPFIYLPLLLDRISKGSKKRESILKVGAQNCFWENTGPFTGEVSALMLQDLGVEYVILGHSERREYFNEGYDVVAKKIKATLKNKLSPILCVGETKERRRNKRIERTLKTQLRIALAPITDYSSSITNLVITYEPIWAVGTGNFCPPNEAKNVLMFIKKELIKFLPREVSQNIRILYGGSVDSENAKAYIDVGFQGFIVGGASLIPREFTKIIKLCNIY
ncbi:MAG: triose-phosphate isomerase [Candidatus Bathyarchaeota archaeon]|nr:triose-phosphate isomerase [Candidatus Bathyarchaeota archaeon]